MKVGFSRTLANLGNSCYCNAVHQCLRQAPLHTWLLRWLLLHLLINCNLEGLVVHYGNQEYQPYKTEPMFDCILSQIQSQSSRCIPSFFGTETRAKFGPLWPEPRCTREPAEAPTIGGDQARCRFSAQRSPSLPTRHRRTLHPAPRLHDSYHYHKFFVKIIMTLLFVQILMSICPNFIVSH